MKLMKMGQNIMKIVLLFMIFIFLSNAQALIIDVSPRGLTIAEIVATNKLIVKAMSILPPLVKTRMQTRLKLEFENLGKEGRWGEAQHQFLKGDKIILDRSLLPDIVAVIEKSRQNLKWATRLQTYYDIALGTILHEVAHFYDEYDGKAISSSSEFLHLNYFRNASDKSRNTLAAKSLNWYEFKSAAESFAVNFEFFLLDADFKCRKPLLYDYFSNNIFKIAPHADSKCAMVNKVFETGDIVENGQSRYVDLELNRLYQVHYLLADKGSEISSRWGHAMIRLVFCAPERNVKGPECLADLAYHKVISFRAVPTTDTVSIKKGLTGKYPSFLFVLPFTQVIRDYTVNELRPVKSVPLNINEEQMHKLLIRTLEVHWSYKGKYYFINNNCAVEALNLIKTVLPDYHNLEDLSAVTPQGVLDVLSEAKVADTSAFDDLNYAWKRGLYYYPNDKVPKMAFSKLKESSKLVGDLTLQEFIFDSNSSKRGQIYQEIFKNTVRTKIELDQRYSSAMYLEKQIFKNLKRKLYSEALLKLTESKEEKQANNKAVTWSESWYYGYGIPTEKDFQNYYLKPNKWKQVQQKESKETLNKKVELLWDKDLKNQLSLSQNNLNYIRTIYEKQVSILKH